jgi:hypothetical protein
MSSSVCVEAVDNLMQTARLLGGLAKAMIEEDTHDICNPQQLIEASARCVDTIELIVEAVKPDDTSMSDFERTDLGKDLKKVRKQLNKMRAEILNLTNPDHHRS